MTEKENDKQTDNDDKILEPLSSNPPTICLNFVIDGYKQGVLFQNVQCPLILKSRDKE